jgi:hypothetical protein
MASSLDRLMAPHAATRYPVFTTTVDSGPRWNNLALSAQLEAGDAQMTRSRANLNEVVRRCTARIQPVATDPYIEPA